MAKVPEAPQADSRMWWLYNRLGSAHAALYKLSRGRIGGKWVEGAPVGLLDTVGARSGKRRTTALIIAEDGENLVAVASKGGIEQHPAWYHNLRANPETTVNWRGEQRAVRARDADGVERERLWAKMVGLYSPYADYQRRTDRQIPVVVLEPTG